MSVIAFWHNGQMLVSAASSRDIPVPVVGDTVTLDRPTPGRYKVTARHIDMQTGREGVDIYLEYLGPP